MSDSLSDKPDGPTNTLWVACCASLVDGPIGAARDIAERYRYDQVVIMARRVGEGPDPHGEHITTYGRSGAHSAVAAMMGQRLQEIAGWPQEETVGTIGEGREERSSTAQRIEEQLNDGEGVWRPCSGCQESVDGCVSTADYPYSPMFRCQPGGGCRECGGIGVIWDTTDYAEMAEHMLADMRAEDEHASSANGSTIAEGMERAARIAEEWKSSLRPGSEARLLGHQEAAKDIASAIRSAINSKVEAP